MSESLGSILFGDRILTSPFDLRMAKNESCKALCTANYPPESVDFVRERIEQGYSLNWLVDGLPAGQEIRDQLTDSITPGS